MKYVLSFKLSTTLTRPSGNSAEVVHCQAHKDFAGLSAGERKERRHQRLDASGWIFAWGNQDHWALLLIWFQHWWLWSHIPWNQSLVCIERKGSSCPWHRTQLVSMQQVTKPLDFSKTECPPRLWWDWMEAAARRWLCGLGWSTLHSVFCHAQDPPRWEYSWPKDSIPHPGVNQSQQGGGNSFFVHQQVLRAWYMIPIFHDHCNRKICIK